MRIFGQDTHSTPRRMNITNLQARMAVVKIMTVATETYWPCGGKDYEVDNKHETLEEFFLAEVPHSGWELIEHKKLQL
jgi:hypothetical protein